MAVVGYPYSGTQRHTLTRLHRASYLGRAHELVAPEIRLFSQFLAREKKPLVHYIMIFFSRNNMRSTNNYGYLSGLMFRSPIAARYRNIALSGSLEGSLCYLNMVMVLVLNMTFLSDVLQPDSLPQFL